MNLSKELQEKLGEHTPTEVDELILDDLFENVSSFSEQNRKDLEKYSNLVHLSLNGFGLENLKNFPKLPTLTTLELRANKLNGSDFNVIHDNFPALLKLKVGENPIKSCDVFKVFANSKLRKVELQETPAFEGSQATLFKLVPTMEVVNWKTKDDEDVSSTLMDEEGEFDEDDDDWEDWEDMDDDEEDFEEMDEDDEDVDDESEEKPRKK